MEAYLAEKMGIKKGLLGDITGGAETARMKMDKCFRATMVINMASAGADLNLQLKQHDALVAGNSKNLAITTRAFVKLEGESVFTEKQIVDGALVDASLNGSAGLVVVEVLAEELDVDANFAYISALFTQGAVARVVSVEYICHAMKNLPAHAVEL